MPKNEIKGKPFIIKICAPFIEKKTLPCKFFGTNVRDVYKHESASGENYQYFFVTLHKDIYNPSLSCNSNFKLNFKVIVVDEAVHNLESKMTNLAFNLRTTQNTLNESTVH